MSRKKIHRYYSCIVKEFSRRGQDGDDSKNIYLDFLFENEGVAMNRCARERRGAGTCTRNRVLDSLGRPSRAA